MTRTRAHLSPSLWLQLGTSLWIGLAATLALLLISHILPLLVFGNRIFPGVSLSGLNLSGLNANEAAALISRSAYYPASGRITLEYGSQQWALSPSQLGVMLDPQATAITAYKIGRSGPLEKVLLDRFNLLRGSAEVQPTFIFNEKATVDFLNAIAAEINQPLQEASLEIQGVDVFVRNGQPGRVLDVAASLARIAAQVEQVRDGVVPLAVIETQPLISDVSEQAELARDILSQPLRFTLPAEVGEIEGNWMLEPTALAKMLTFERVQDGGTDSLAVVVNPTLAGLHLDSLRDSLDAEPQNARFIFNDETGLLDLKDSAVIGRKLNIQSSLENINSSLKAGSHEAQLVFDITPPAVTDSMTGAELGITELVYEYTSYFYGSSPDRVQNIKTASSSFHGLLVPPGGVLSMADELGDISLDNGYAEALIILGDETIKGVGGGVCQVSTTLFRTAYFAGYPILERHAHAYRVGYYEQTPSGGHNANLAGLDATVFVPLVDFKFKNDSDHWLLMETYVYNNTALTWKFYSTKDGRQVEHSTTGPTQKVKAPDDLYRENPELKKGEVKQVDWAAEGARVVVTRRVTRGGELLYNDTFTTVYEPWRNIFEYGPGTEDMPPDKKSGSAEDEE